VVNFDQTPLRPTFLIPMGDSFWRGIVAIPENDKSKDYAHYAAHCLCMVTVASDRDSRTIQREMAAEWIRLADSVRPRPRRKQMQME
jgi:hypothetical protein